MIGDDDDISDDDLIENAATFITVGESDDESAELPDPSLTVRAFVDKIGIQLEREHQRTLNAIMDKKISALATEVERIRFASYRRADIALAAALKKTFGADPSERMPGATESDLAPFIEPEAEYDPNPTAPRQVGNRRNPVEVVRKKRFTKKAS
jgi:hypothetical protein